MNMKIMSVSGRNKNLYKIGGSIRKNIRMKVPVVSSSFHLFKHRIIRSHQLPSILLIQRHSLILLNSSVRLVNDSSTPILSKDDAPTKPCNPSVRLKTYSTSSGVLIGPPCVKNILSGFDFFTASIIFCVLSIASSIEAVASVTPIDPPTVVPT